MIPCCPCWSCACLAFATSFWQGSFGPSKCRFREETQCVSSGLGKSQIPFLMNEFSDYDDGYYYFYACKIQSKTLVPWKPRAEFLLMSPWQRFPPCFSRCFALQTCHLHSFKLTILHLTEISPSVLIMNHHPVS